MEGLKPQALNRALTQLIRTAAQDIAVEQQQVQYQQMASMQHVASSPTYWATTAASTTTPVTTAGYGITMGGAPSGPYSSSNYTYATPVTPAPAFTDAQMASLVDKLTTLLAKGWECIRCHRIWNPRETGCEFCNFIDRLEGKDVDRDSTA